MVVCCEHCKKEFAYPYMLKRHIARKYKCYTESEQTNTTNTTNDIDVLTLGDEAIKLVLSLVLSEKEFIQHIVEKHKTHVQEHGSPPVIIILPTEVEGELMSLAVPRHEIYKTPIKSLCTTTSLKIENDIVTSITENESQ